MSLFGALPFIFHGSIPNFSDAFFETMSGFTTTGASILTDIESMPHGLLILAIVYTVDWRNGNNSFISGNSSSFRNWRNAIYAAEVPGITKDKLHPRVKETAKRLWIIYLAFTVAEAILLMIAGINFFDAINHSFTTMATGGFSTKNASTAYFTSPFIQYILYSLYVLCRNEFYFTLFCSSQKFSFFKNNDEFRYYLFLIIISVFITLIHLPYVDFHPEESFRQSLFHVVSLVTTTGYVSSDYENWAVFSRMIFFILLFIGGCAGSTGGGIKVIRHFLLFKNGILN